MSTTTQILFNSPALHSLKRDQLVKLCKIHSIKASGRNVDLIERLKQHASSLPPDAPLHLAVRSETSSDDEPQDDPEPRPHFAMPRPSEQWEVVMDNIDEVPESSSAQNTLTSSRTMSRNGTEEFGTAASKTSSVSSSIRALASSLGIRRAMSTATEVVSDSDTHSSTTHHSKSNVRDSLAAHAVPYSSLPDSSLPITDHFILNGEYDAPIPGNPLLPGAPAPPNARLSLTNPITSTTIRLVTTPFQSMDIFPTPPRLQPFKTSFDLVMGSPRSSAPKWPASPFKNSGAEKLYPAIPTDDIFASQEAESVKVPGNPSMSPSQSLHTLSHGSFEPVVDVFSPTPQTLVTSSPAPTANGTNCHPLPRSEPFLFGSPLPQHRLSNNDFGKAAASVLDEMNKRLGLTGERKVGMDILTNRDKLSSVSDEEEPTRVDKFGFTKAHDNAFRKMDSIASHYAAKRPNPAKDRMGVDEADAVVPGTKKRKAEALGVDEICRPSNATKRANAAGTRVISNGTRKKMIPGSFEDEEDDKEEDRRLSKRPRVGGDEEVKEEQTVRIKTDEEAIRKAREIEAVRRKAEARRRSSRVHQGINTGLARQSIGTGGRGRVSMTNKLNKGPTSRFGFLSSAKNMVKNVWKGVGSTIATSAPTGTVPKSAGSKHPVSKLVKPNPTIKTGSTNSKASIGTVPCQSVSSKTSTKPAAASGSSSRSRFGFGSWNAAASSSTTSSGVRSAVGSSSLGQRQRGSINTAGSSTRSSVTSNPGGSSKRPSSTLMAPTASSLARTRSIRPPESNKNSTRASLQAKRSSHSNMFVNEKSAPDTITNSHATTSQASPRRIFIEALTTATFSSPSKIPIHIPAKTAAPSSVVVPPKSKTLTPRRPRISRSRVIAKLGAQRIAANTAAGTSQCVNRSSIESGKVRSSLGNGVRKSYGGVKTRTSGGGDVLLSAKKKARASEYARRKSKAAQQKAVGDVEMIEG